MAHSSITNKAVDAINYIQKVPYCIDPKALNLFENYFVEFLREYIGEKEFDSVFLKSQDKYYLYPRKIYIKKEMEKHKELKNIEKMEIKNTSNEYYKKVIIKKHVIHHIVLV